MIALEFARQAQMQAFIDLFWFIGWVTFALLPLVLLVKRNCPVGDVDCKKLNLLTVTPRQSPACWRLPP